MVTSAGRLRKNTSQGWPSSSASRHPAHQDAERHADAHGDHEAGGDTRSSVTARFQGSSPVALSRTICASTAAGGGIRRGLAASDRRELPQGQQRQERQRAGPATRRSQPRPQRRERAVRPRRGSARRARHRALSSSPWARRCRAPAPGPCRPASRRRARPGPDRAWRPRPAARSPQCSTMPSR